MNFVIWLQTIFSNTFLFLKSNFLQILHNHGILVLADGAHAPGQADFSIEDLDVDFYVAR